MADPAPPLAASTGRPWTRVLASGPDPAAVIARLRTDDRPAVLWGRWFGGGAVIMARPLRRHRLRSAADAGPLLDDQPRLVGPPAGAMGGGWLACLGFAEHTSRLAFYDCVLRRRPDGTWVFETLGLQGRDDHVRAQLAAYEEVLRQAQDTGCAAQDPKGAKEPKGWVGEFRAVLADGAEERHLAAVEAAVGRIGRGDFYQVNLCTRLVAPFAGSPVRLFASMAAELDPAYGALVVFDEREAVVSLSPELFLAEHDGGVRSAPIKGTTALNSDPDGQRLSGSAKDAAENVMITDLVRNDLSRVCRSGTVVVEDLLDRQRHPGVWHLVSTVAGQLRPGTATSELLGATFPPGSVTGAPKSSALAGIADLEPNGRGAYTGALGLITPSDGAELSVLIRALEIADGRAELGVGGGITADSVAVLEWQECLDKAGPLARAAGSRLAPALVRTPERAPPDVVAAGLIETLLVVRGQVLRLPAHLARLERSCAELYGEPLPAHLSGRIAWAAAGHDRARLRLTVRPGAGAQESVLQLTTDPLDLPPTRLRLAARPRWSWRHKWADRRALTAAEGSTIPALPYFVAPGGWVAETSRGNLFSQAADGTWSTPPADDQLLPGVTRRAVLDLLGDLGHRVRLRRFPADELRRATAVFWTSSLRGAVPVDRVDDATIETDGPLVDVLNARLGTADRAVARSASVDPLPPIDPDPAVHRDGAEP